MDVIEIRKENAFECLVKMETDALQLAINLTKERQNVMSYSDIDKLVDYFKAIQYFGTRVEQFYNGIAPNETSKEEENSTPKENTTW